MALNDQVLKSFFDKRKVTPISSSRNFRVFDDPSYRSNDNTDVASEKTEDKVESKLGANQRQTEYKPETKKRQTEYKLKTELETKVETNQRQNTAIRSPLTTYSSLSGLQRKITLFIYDQCKIAMSNSTKQLAIEYLSNRCQTTVSSAKKTIQRLIQKTIIDRVEYKDGRNGWSKYQLNNHIFQEILTEESHSNFSVSNINWRQTEDKLEHKLETQLKTTPSSSSSLKKLTTKEEGTDIHSNTSNLTTLPPEWESINFSFLEDIGFNKNKLMQIYGAGKLSAEIVQESLYGYDFDRKHNSVKHDSPINFLMAQLKVKGFPYDLPKNYESPKVRAMREYLERMEANEKKEQELKDTLKTREFEKWFNSLSLEEQNTLVPPHGMFAKGGPRRAAFFKHFDENHWAEKEKVLFAGIFA